MDAETLHRESKRAIEKVRAEYSRLIRRLLLASPVRQNRGDSCPMVAPSTRSTSIKGTLTVANNE